MNGQALRRPAVRGASDVSGVEKLTTLAARVQRLVASHRDPHRFHHDKREIVAELQRLADEVRRG